MMTKLAKLKRKIVLKFMSSIGERTVTPGRMCTEYFLLVVYLVQLAYHGTQLKKNMI